MMFVSKRKYNECLERLENVLLGKKFIDELNDEIKQKLRREKLELSHKISSFILEASSLRDELEQSQKLITKLRKQNKMLRRALWKRQK